MPEQKTHRIPKLLTAKTVIGNRIMNLEREHLGKVEDLMLDMESGRVTYAILSFGGFLGLGDKRFAIPWPMLQILPEEHAFLLDADKQLLKNAPGFDKDRWPGTEMNDPGSHYWAEVYTYYGYTPYWDE